MFGVGRDLCGSSSPMFPGVEKCSRLYRVIEMLLCHLSNCDVQPVEFA